jgi:hypothetical protein
MRTRIFARFNAKPALFWFASKDKLPQKPETKSQPPKKDEPESASLFGKRLRVGRDIDVGIFYKELGVPRNATLMEVQRAYEKLGTNPICLLRLMHD